MSGGDLTRRELALAATAAVLVAVVTTWPLVLHLGTVVPRDVGDPLAIAWQPAWGGHAILHQPLDFFDANRFWPIDDSLAFGDALIGYAPAGLIGDGPKDAIVRYDLLFIFSYALAFFGAYLLARELGIGPAGAAVAGMAFAFAPFRLEQDGHMQVIASGGIPLSLAFGVRGIRLRQPWWLFAAWLVAAWQVSLGFVLGLPFAYGLAGACLVATIVWLIRGRPPIPRRMLVGGLAGAVAFVGICGYIARTYLEIADEFPEAKRELDEVAGFSGPLKVFITAPRENFVWGDATEGVREDLENIPEKTLFPGALILVLALVGLGSRGLDRRLRIGLGVAAVAVMALQLGFREEGGLLWPYRVVYELLPGWDAIRTPGRLATFSSLALALLAAAGAEAVIRAVGRRIHPAWATTAVAVLLALGIATEGRSLPFDPFDDQAMPEVPDLGTSTADVPAPQLHLPATTAEHNRAYQLASTDGFPDLVNGRASTNPSTVLDLIDDMATFPDSASVRRLQDWGVRTVIIHLDQVEGTPQEGTTGRPTTGLPIRRYELPGLVLYEVSSNASSGPSEGSDAAPASVRD
ncbi:MAG TPA: hypothetical protein VFT14_02760 [Solirubrobacterales bacterium]|nr:hypothetical protein [Solirubrobacterales bacterium]